MEFTLYYRGELKANRGPKDKQALRRIFHEQLKLLWDQIPLNERHELISQPPMENKANIILPVNGFKFAPLVSKNIDTHYLKTFSRSTKRF